MQKVRGSFLRVTAELALVTAVILGIVGWAYRPDAPVGPLVCSIPHEQPPARGSVVPGRADLSGRARLGKASFYAHSFAHRVMANGRRMDPQGDNAASRTLPLGTTAKVTNIRTGESAVVSIEDRGPYVAGRIVDLSPATARQIGITRRIGVAEVKVSPISVRLPDGDVKAGAGALRAPVCRASRS